MILHLLEITVGGDGAVGILDLQQGKLFEPTKQVANIDLLLISEAAAFSVLWKSL